jgi:kynurenine formamidase
MDNLDQLPATGAIIFIAYPRVEGATGLPVRAWAVFE